MVIRLGEFEQRIRIIKRSEVMLIGPIRTSQLTTWHRFDACSASDGTVDQVCKRPISF